MLGPPSVAPPSDRTPHLPAAGLTNEAHGETAEKTLKPEFFGKAPPTPTHIKKWRKETEPGKICLHPGVAEDADYDEINAVYEELEAKYKGDVKRIIKLKVARDKILEDRLRQRMQGTLQANDDVRVASDNFSDEKKPLIKLPRFLERITMFPTKDLMLKNAAVFAFVAFLPVLDKSWASTSLGLGFGVSFVRRLGEARR